MVPQCRMPEDLEKMFLHFAANMIGSCRLFGTSTLTSKVQVMSWVMVSINYARNVSMSSLMHRVIQGDPNSSNNAIEQFKHEH